MLRSDCGRAYCEFEAFDRGEDRSRGFRLREAKGLKKILWESRYDMSALQQQTQSISAPAPQFAARGRTKQLDDVGHG